MRITSFCDIRRDVIRLGAGLAAGLVAASPALAQLASVGEFLGKLLGLVPPSKPVNLMRTIAAIVEMERLADRRGLPPSRLSLLANGVPSADSDASLYQMAMPRLVTLIDRSEGEDPGLSDQAGEVLADLHASQHEIAEALKPDAPVEDLRVIASHKFDRIREEYASLFASAKARPEHAETLAWHFEAIKKFRLRYEALGKETGVPWYFIGAIHGLESSFNFRAHFHNGDFPLRSRTRQVPAGRPRVWAPPSDWESSAKDALKLLGFTGQSDWSLERTLYRLEAYDGFGYRKRGVATPYLWSFSSHYERGKFVSDGHWNADARSQQCGAATVIKALTDAGVVVFA
jgi:lysozyme family protein